MGLASLSRRPTPVAVGGALLRASPLRLADLMDLEHWVSLRAPDPLADLGDPDAPDYPDRLRAAYDAAASWPPGLGTPAADALVYGTAEGQALFLMLALRDEGLTADDAADLLSAMEPAEWQAIEEVAFGSARDLFAEVSKMVDAHIGVPPFVPKRTPSSGTVSWEKAIAEQCDGDPAKYEACRNLTLAEWRLLRSGGEARRNYDPVPADRDAEREAQRLRAEFWRAGRKAKSPGDGPQVPPQDADGLAPDHAVLDAHDHEPVGRLPGGVIVDDDPRARVEPGQGEA